MIKIKGRFALDRQSQLRFKTVERVNLINLIWQTADGLLASNDVGFAFLTTVVAATNGGSITYEVVDGALPGGMTLGAASGAISGTPLVAGVYEFTIRASASGLTADRSFSLAIDAITLAWTTAANLGTIRAGDLLPAFAATSSSGRTPTIEHRSGLLPPGLLLDGGLVSGAALNQGGTYTFTLRARDGAVAYLDRLFSVVLDPDVITWVTPAAFGSIDGALNFTRALSATSHYARPVTYTLTAGALPSGLDLVNGVISGVPANVSGGFSFTIEASDGVASASRTFTGSIVALSLSWATSGTIPRIDGGDSVNLPLTATASNGGTVTYALVSGAYPSGLSYAAGSLSGTATNVAEAFSFTLRASYGTLTAERTFTGSITRAVVTWTSPAGSLGSINQGEYYESFLTATSTSRRTVTYSLYQGSLPSGLSVLPTGVLGGTPSGAAGEYSFTVRASDGTAFADQGYSFTLVVPPQWVSPPALGAASMGESIERSLVATSDTSGVSYAIVDAEGGASRAAYTIPPSNDANAASITLDLSPDGLLTGSIDSTDPKRPVWTTPSGKLGEANKGYAFTGSIAATPHPERSIARYNVVGNRVLPAGLSLNVASGAITGLADLYPAQASAPLKSLTPVPEWVTDPYLGVFNTALSRNVVNLTLSATPKLGTAITRYDVITSQPCNLPTGVVLSTAGALAGSLTVYSVANPAYVPPVGPSFIQAAGPLGSATNGTAISLSLTATPVSGTTVVFHVLDGALPQGALLTTTSTTTATATIAGTLDAAVPGTTLAAPRSFTFTIRAIGSDGGISDRTFSYIVNP